MKELNETIRHILFKHSTGELDNAGVSYEIQEILRANGGKLYKYRRFDPEGHSMMNLLNQELYCSQPSKFNDPFDCRVGIDIQSIAKRQFGSFSLVEEAFQDFSAILRGDKMLESCSSDIKPIISKLLQLKDNTDFCTLITECEKQKHTDAQMINLLQQHPSVFNSLLTVLVSITLEKTNFANSSVPIEMFTKIFSELNPNKLVIEHHEIDIVASLAKTYEISDDIDEISLLKRIFQLAQPEKSPDLNDMDDQFSKLDDNLRKLIDQNFYVGCLSEKYDDVLMWAHYGEGHAGFCIEYDFNRINLKDEELSIFPVLYSKERPPIPWDISIDKTSNETKRAEYDFILSMLTKDSSWSYEKEWRILRSIISQSEVVSLPITSCIYLGANCTQENKNKIIEVAQVLHIPVQQMVVDRVIYKLHAVPISL